MSNKFKTIESISRRISSGITPLRSNQEFWENGTIPWLKTEQLGEYEITETNEHINEIALRKTGIKLNSENTVSVAMYGEGRTRGNVSILKTRMTTNQACCNIEVNPEIASYRYVYYWLKCNYHQLRSLSSGVRKNLNADDIKNFPFNYKELDEQENIAKILSAIDDKIQLNNKINSELENLAKTIYNYWFVQFDFPNEEGKPYKTSGGEMEWNEELKREIPKAWKATKIGEYADVRKGDLITAKDALEGEIKVVAAGIDFSYTHTKSNRDRNTITISGSGANAGFINFWREPIFASDCITVRGNSDTETLLLLYYLRFIQSHILQKATGSAQPHVYPDDIKNLYYAVPNDSTIKKFAETIIPINEQIALCNSQNNELIKLRDFLLPMLMNGQVKVKSEAKEQLSMAAEPQVKYGK